MQQSVIVCDVCPAGERLAAGPLSSKPIRRRCFASFHSIVIPLLTRSPSYLPPPPAFMNKYAPSFACIYLLPKRRSYNRPFILFRNQSLLSVRCCAPSDLTTPVDAVSPPINQMTIVDEFSGAGNCRGGDADTAAEPMVATAEKSADGGADAPAAAKPSLNSPPIEIMEEILSDLRGLASLLLTSRCTYWTFTRIRETVMTAALSRELPLPVRTCCRYVSSAIHPDESIDSLCLNQQLIRRFADSFTAWSFYFHQDSVPVTEAENMRVQRSIYRYFVLCAIYAKSHSLFEVASYCAELAPWEVEELMIVVAFIHQLTWATCESSLPPSSTSPPRRCRCVASPSSLRSTMCLSCLCVSCTTSSLMMMSTAANSSHVSVPSTTPDSPGMTFSTSVSSGCRPARLCAAFTGPCAASSATAFPDSTTAVTSVPVWDTFASAPAASSTPFFCLKKMALTTRRKRSQRRLLG